MALRIGGHRRVVRRTAQWLLGVALLAAAAAHGEPVRQLREAVRMCCGEAPRNVTLPDNVEGEPDSDAIITPSYRLRAEFGAVPGLSAIYLPGLFAHARIAINGHVVADRIGEPQAPLPRGADRLLLATVTPELLRPGANDIEIALAAPRRTSLSSVWIGPESELRLMQERKLLRQIIGPVSASAVILAMSLCVLLLWARRPRETLYAYFGIGGVLWALHTIWTVLPDPLLPPPHLAIWWTMGYPFFVAPLVVFCVRLARWSMPRFERALWLGLVVGPPLLYGAHAAGVLDAALDYWRLVWIGAVAVAVVAVGRYAIQRRDAQGVLLLATGAIAFGFAVRDWLLDQDLSDNNPVFLTNYSGLLFFPLVAWILIDGFVQATRELERLNAELERRVASKSAQLQLALDDMRTAKDAAETANRAKTTFLAAASHDLRQPMHALGLYMAALRSEKLNRPQAELIERMSESLVATDALFDGLLDISRIDAGAVVPSRRPFALQPLLHRLAEEFSRVAAAKGVRMSLHLPRAARHINVDSDPLLIERIVRNLLGNAVKYTEQGGVLLAGRLRGAAGGRWQIEVWDTGPGIPLHERERIFDEFYQLGQRERDHSAGFGLGLSIVRRLAHLLVHPLRVDSVVGRGSRFVLELPTTREAPRAVVPPMQTGSLRGLYVAVIDDDRSVREAMQTLLRSWECHVVAGSNAPDVLHQLGTRAHLHAAVVDFQLGDGHNGVDAIAALRAACGSTTPALLVSGASAREPLAELQASGFEWLIKPVAPARLRSWLIHATRFERCMGEEPLPTRREALASKDSA